MTDCSHSYRIPRGDKTDFCLTCKQFVERLPEISTQELIMPPRIFEITEQLWKEITPWTLLSYELVEEHMWYISLIQGKEYLIMPVMRGMKPIYYSARKLAKTDGLKYLYPTGVKKSYWLCDRGKDTPIIITEGVADAVYCSAIGSSIGILGCYYNGSLDDYLANRHVSICLDGDSAGILAAMHILEQLKNVASKKITILPNKLDPTDIPIDKLTKLIYT